METECYDRQRNNWNDEGRAQTQERKTDAILPDLWSWRLIAYQRKEKRVAKIKTGRVCERIRKDIKNSSDYITPIYRMIEYVVIHSRSGAS